MVRVGYWNWPIREFNRDFKVDGAPPPPHYSSEVTSQAKWGVSTAYNLCGEKLQYGAPRYLQVQV